MSPNPYFRLALWTLAFFILLVGWDMLGLDLALARWFGGADGFALRGQWFLSSVLHQDARRVAWAMQFGLVLCIWWPVGVLRQLTRRERVHMLAATLMALFVVWALKSRSRTSCPWDLMEFGGPAAYISHWTWGKGDGGVGRCFPAGHASAAFCFVAGYFWLREKAPRAAKIWLAVALLAGSLIGLSQQLRGAHYMSHTLWTAWLCWAVAGLMYLVLERSPLRALSAWSRRART